MHIMCRVVCVLLESGPDLWVPPLGMIPRSGTLASFPLRYLRLRASLQFNSIATFCESGRSASGCRGHLGLLVLAVGVAVAVAAAAAGYLAHIYHSHICIRKGL